MNELISIIIPAYQVEKYIGECIASIKNQTYQNFEAIIVDDGSSDQTNSRIKTAIQGDARFQLIEQENSGTSVARNSGILAATGKYLTFLDGDDLWLPNYLELLHQAIIEHHTDMSYCGYTHLYTNGLKRKYSYPYFSGNISIPVIQGKTHLRLGSMMVKRKILTDHHLLFTLGCLVGQDDEFIWKVTSLATVQSVPQELLLYRIRPGSAITANWNWRKHIHAIYGYQRAAAFILEQSTLEFDPSAMRKILDERIAYRFFKFVWRMVKHGYQEDARAILSEEKYKELLHHLPVKKLKLTDRLKYRIVASEAKVPWLLARFM